MTKNDDKKIGGVKGTKVTTAVEGTDLIGGVAGVKATTGIGGVKGAGGIDKRRPTRTMTLAEREQLFQMINEEAEKLFGNSPMSATERNVVKNAVRMALDTGIIPDEDGDNKKK